MSETIPAPQENSDSELTPGPTSDNDEDLLSVHPPFADDEDDEVDDTKDTGNNNDEGVDSDASVDNFNVSGDGTDDEDSLSSHGSLPSDDEAQHTDEEGDGVKDEHEEDGDEDEDEDEEYLQKLDKEMVHSHIAANHPESVHINYNEVLALCNVTRDAAQNVIDPLHRTIPILTKYEYARVLGLRATQINAGAKPFVEVEKKIVDGYLIAQIEIRQKKIPFIIRRPLPGGGTEYWRLSDLEILF